MKKLITAALSLMSMVCMSVFALAGSLDSPGAPSAGSGMYTLQNLYDYIVSGTALEAKTSFQEPSAAPGSTMKTTKEIGDALKSSFDQCNATTADSVEQGKPFFCTQPGSWGVQTGTLSALPRPTATPTITPTSTPTPTPTPTPTFPCGTAFTDSRNSKVYNTVLIGTQCWMQENLDYDNGCIGIGLVDGCSVDRGGCAYYPGGPYTNEGLLYQYSAAIAVCPAGWHLARDSELCTMEALLAEGCLCPTGRNVCAGVGKHMATWTLNGDNSSGFSALQSGYWHCDGSGFRTRNDNCTWLSAATPLPTPLAAAFILRPSEDGISNHSDQLPAMGYTVRCIHD
ncbi:MAG: hypothetical protein NTZ78_07780 [Candidatus Aureabacteria bacterium]|nr:hypothetical protein [Candidatus Auribacterota bacterium]